MITTLHGGVLGRLGASDGTGRLANCRDLDARTSDAEYRIMPVKACRPPPSCPVEVEPALASPRDARLLRLPSSPRLRPDQHQPRLCRQLLSRARHRIRTGADRVPITREEHGGVSSKILAAADNRNLAGLVEQLPHDSVA